MSPCQDQTCHVELLTPKQSSPDFEADLDKFAANFARIIDAGCVVCIPDNPMGVLAFQATEVLPELDIHAPEGRLLLHLNTFHTKAHLDDILDAAEGLGVTRLLVVTGDGGPRLPKLDPGALGLSVNSVTSIELIRHIRDTRGDRFLLGCAFNPYEPGDHEAEKLRRKIDAGARFVITQPVFGCDPRVSVLREFGIPVVVGAWMSRNLGLLSQCVGYELPAPESYDPFANLGTLRACYPEWCMYLALVGYKSQLPRLGDLCAGP